MKMKMRMMMICLYVVYLSFYYFYLFCLCLYSCFVIDFYFSFCLVFYVFCLSLQIHLDVSFVFCLLMENVMERIWNKQHQTRDWEMLVKLNVVYMLTLRFWLASYLVASYQMQAIKLWKYACKSNKILLRDKRQTVAIDYEIRKPTNFWSLQLPNE